MSDPKAWKCPDCGSTRWDRNGARALDEAREIGLTQGIEGALLVLGSNTVTEAALPFIEAMANKIRALLPGKAGGCTTPESCEAVLMVHGVSHGPWCPAKEKP
jgi:hypothetical protein